MNIGLGQQNYLHTLLQRKNPTSEFLKGDYETGYPIYKVAEKLDQKKYKYILALLFNDKVEQAEKELQSI